MFAAKFQRCCLALMLALFCYPQVCSAQFRRIVSIAGCGEEGAFRTQGRASQMYLTNPFGIVEESDGALLITSFDQHTIFRLDSTYTVLDAIIGVGEAGLAGAEGDRVEKVRLNQPHEVVVDAIGNIYVADTLNHRVGMVEKSTGRWKVVAGTGKPGFSGDNGQANVAMLHDAYSIVVDGLELFIADLKNHRIRRVQLDTGKIATLCGNGEKGMPTDGGKALEQPLAGPRSLAVDEENLWIVLREGNSIWRMDRRTSRIYHVAGTGEKGFSGDGGPAVRARLNGPKGIAVDPGQRVFIADTENNAVRMINLQTGRISTVVGSAEGKTGYSGEGDDLERRLLSRPHGLCLLRGGELVIGDSENHRVRMLLP